MLMVSEMLRVATGGTSARGVARRSPLRFRRRGEAPSVVVWNVCKHCNMSCPHCYAAAVDTPSPGDLGTDEAKSLLDQLADAGVAVVIFSGGEPLLRDDLFELLAHARGVGLLPQLSTNGVLIDEAVAARLARCGVGYVGVSIDGLAPFNDPYRGLQDGFRRASDGLRHAKAAGLRTGLRVTVTRRNAEHVPALFAHAREVRADRFYVSHLVYSGRGSRLSGEDLRPEETRALLVRLFERAVQVLDEPGWPDVVTGSNDSDGVLLVRWLEDRFGAVASGRVEDLLRRRGGNSAGESLLCIDHRGRVHPDQFWRSCVLGDVRVDGFAAALRHSMRMALAERVSKLEGRCGACRFVATCRGSHRERALEATGRLWASDPACVMSDEEIGYALAPAAGGATGGSAP